MPLECGDGIWRQKTRTMVLPYGEEIMIVKKNFAAYFLHLPRLEAEYLISLYIEQKNGRLSAWSGNRVRF